jgi:hypothetical protein
MIRCIALLFVYAAVSILCACGTSSHDCTPTPIVVTVSPSNGSADHVATAPGNQVQFTATSTGGDIASGCAIPDIAFSPEWVSSDPTDIQFSDTQKGLATCTNGTSGSTTVTATIFRNGTSGKGTASLTCN